MIFEEVTALFAAGGGDAYFSEPVTQLEHALQTAHGAHRAGSSYLAAKRYRVATEPGYRARLSRASRLSLRLQGGPMRAGARAAFEGSEHCAAALRLRA